MASGMKRGWLSRGPAPPFALVEGLSDQATRLAPCSLGLESARAALDVDIFQGHHRAGKLQESQACLLSELAVGAVVEVSLGILSPMLPWVVCFFFSHP